MAEWELLLIMGMIPGFNGEGTVEYRNAGPKRDSSRRKMDCIVYMGAGFFIPAPYARTECQCMAFENTLEVPGYVFKNRSLTI
jgi:hypothetical protein